MKVKNLWLSTLVITALLGPLQSFGDDILETDWLETEAGSTGNAIGAKVIKVEQQDDVTMVDVSVPLEELENYEEVMVYGYKPAKPEPIILLKDVEWLRDNNKDAYGVRFYVKGVPSLQFQLKFYDGDEFELRE